jgi:5-oxoprolinase (ATP-hydrolysing)
MESERNIGDTLAEVWCDIGGTFTDCFVRTSQGNVLRAKFLSHGRVPGRVHAWDGNRIFADPMRTQDPEAFWIGAKVHLLDRNGKPLGTALCQGFDANHGSLLLNDDAWQNLQDLSDVVSYEIDPGIEAPVLAAHWLLRVPLAQALPPLAVRLGTTRGTNALLTRSGAPTVFATTRGFRDLLEIAYQERPELFVLTVRKRAPLYEQVIEVDERLDAHGGILRPLDGDAIEAELSRAYAAGYRSLAICLIHSYLNPEHERAVAQIAQRIGFETICCSSEIAPVIRAVSRGETTVVDAYLTPVVRSYLSRIRSQFGIGTEKNRSLRVMTSSGGLVDASLAWGREMILSGPAGGAVALEALADAHKTSKLIGLDMGGTSTDVCRIDGRMQLDHETIKAGVRMVVPTLAIHTVAAGGGSVCWFDGVQLRVGPHSAGSDPGPACYGRGGPLTVTDLNLVAGRIDPDQFPIPLDREASQTRVRELLQLVQSHPWFQEMDSRSLVQGLRRIANEQMASAVRAISIQQGADPREHVLVGFGGAAGQHICEVAEILGMNRILDPSDAGLLSALGMGLAQIKRSMVIPLYRPLIDVQIGELAILCDRMRFALVEQMQSEKIAQEDLFFDFEVALRYRGTEGSLRIPWHQESILELRDSFDREHQRRFGSMRPDRPLEILELRGQASTRRSAWGSPPSIESSDGNGMKVGEYIVGPRLIQRLGSTTYIDSGWEGVVLPDHSLSIVRCEQRDAPKWKDAREETDPVLREVLAQRIAAIADQMGIVLEQTATSVNVKQRRDFSCAVFDTRGDLIANAPHVPVHLGAMSETVKGMIDRFPCMRPGDCFVTNDPYCGGSHLPDITVVTPVFLDDSKVDVDSQPLFFVASRAHHAEVGGIAPGSMSPNSKRLGEEGVLIPPMVLARGRAGLSIEDCADEVEQLLRTATYPSRSVSENMSDLAAQQVANDRGVVAMRELAKSFGADRLSMYLASVLEAAEEKTRQWIATLEDRDRRWSDCMDDGSRIEVLIQRTKRYGKPHLRVDFTGTGPASSGNLNANRGIVTAAVLYCIRCAIADSMPLNSGVLRAVEIIIPEGILNPQGSGDKENWPAVAGGNVETSQRVVDCILGALGLAAASQGTMNNFLFGNRSFGYYETIGGGSGATADGPGADAVHTHMTNTRLTDIEVLESRYPVRLVEFGIRRGSGGRGRNRGGDGMVRQIQALESLEVSLVTSRRGPYAPFGLEGGEPGQLGSNVWIHANGQQQQLSASCQIRIEEGDSIRIETPGGGAYGAKSQSL